MLHTPTPTRGPHLHPLSARLGRECPQVVPAILPSAFPRSCATAPGRDPGHRVHGGDAKPPPTFWPASGSAPRCQRALAKPFPRSTTAHTVRPRPVVTLEDGVRSGGYGSPWARSWPTGPARHHILLAIPRIDSSTTGTTRNCSRNSSWMPIRRRPHPHTPGDDMNRLPMARPRPQRRDSSLEAPPLRRIRQGRQGPDGVLILDQSSRAWRTFAARRDASAPDSTGGRRARRGDGVGPRPRERVALYQTEGVEWNKPCSTASRQVPVRIVSDREMEQISSTKTQQG